MQKTVKIWIKGLVQGVGFRPFVYRLALQTSLSGYVKNTEKGVLIVVSGNTGEIEVFSKNLIKNPPQAAQIISVETEECTNENFKGFTIQESDEGEKPNLALTPDFALCAACAAELQEPSNRRHHYPFISCVDCGPRWSVTQRFPFDRKNTTFGSVTQCPNCLVENKDPQNRRFHSQTNTCSECGFSLQLTTADREKVTLSGSSVFEKAAALLEGGQILAVKNTSGFLLCCRADNDETVQKLRKRKQRPGKPLAVLFKDIKEAEKFVILGSAEKEALLSSERPIVLAQTVKNMTGLAMESVAPGLDRVGVMLPTTGILFLLARSCHFPIIATSGNLHGSPIVADNSAAYERLKTVADAFLVHNLHIQHPQDDSVVKFSSIHRHQVMLRRARGFAPNLLAANNISQKKCLALGADLKSSIVFSPHTYIYQSPYLGNLNNYEVFERFSETAADFMDIFQQKPEVILADAHPGYQSHQFGNDLAAKLHIPIQYIQHHKAHFAAILGEHQLWNEKVLGVVFDGTGLGDDGQIWGGEFFDYRQGSMERLHHLKYYDWLAGDKMAKETRLSLMALSKDNVDAETGKKFTPDEFHFYKKLMQQNTLKTSSVGRLFDALSSLLELTDYNTYEGQGAMLLENCILESDKMAAHDYLPGKTDYFSGKYILQFACNELFKGERKGKIAASFIFTLASYIVRFARVHGYKNIACSGGVFQNAVLTDYLLDIAGKEINIYLHQNLSPNDENIAFGQMMYHLHIPTKDEVPQRIQKLSGYAKST